MRGIFRPACFLESHRKLTLGAEDVQIGFRGDLVWMSFLTQLLSVHTVACTMKFH
jgi:hypothetical protein